MNLYAIHPLSHALTHSLTHGYIIFFQLFIADSFLSGFSSFCLFTCFLFFYFSFPFFANYFAPVDGMSLFEIIFVNSATTCTEKYELLPLSKENKGKSFVLGCNITLYIDDCAEKMMKKI